MRIGKQNAAFTAIATSDADTITIRGLDLCGDLIGKVGFTDYFYFLVTGEMPTDDQRFFTDAVLVAIAEHGLVPSVQAARMTLAAAPEAWQGAMAAGLLGVGSVVAGSSEAAGKFLVALLDEAKKTGASFEDAAQAGLKRLVAEKQKVPGLGHPQHATGDPRANLLLKLADERGVTGDHVAHAAASGEARAGDHRAGAPDQCQRRDPRGDARRRLSGRGDQGPAASRPHRRAGRASLRGSAALDRLHHVEPRRPGDHLRRRETAREITQAANE